MRCFTLLVCCALALAPTAHASLSDVFGKALSTAAADARIYYDLNEASAPMRIERSRLSEYRIYMGQSGTYVTLNQKSWGVWNLDSWVYEDEGGAIVLAGGGTDWEYVFRVSDNRAGLVFCGGNHGNEYLESLEFFDDTTNVSLGELLLSRSAEAPRIRAVEKTRLGFGAASGNAFALVTRTYTFSNQKIILETDIDFTRDVVLATSYTCMFPVNKTFGRFCSFDDVGLIVEAPLGESSPSGDYLGKVPTTSATLWGDDNRFHFRVKIYDADVMTGEFGSDLKTFLWSILPYQAKLYFTKYEQNTVSLVRGGESWRMMSSWELLSLPGSV